ncbi:uncharacterized protein BXZ73DRAFT_9991, partial [Epithele typhae]|uniref:uncharacterized protein n=1 Tax=Epithele typhae TaxID=378194 RepID=UPI00200795D0
GDEGYTLTGYGELSSDEPFTLPPSPTQTIKYRYCAFRPKAKLARLGSKSARSRALAGLKTSSSAYHAGSNVSFSLAHLPSLSYSRMCDTRAQDALAQLLSGVSRGSPKRDFQALMNKYRESA